MNYQDGENDNYGYGEPKKKSAFLTAAKWTVYSICILIIIIVIYRLISTATPKELKNYLINSPKIEETYKNLKDDFMIYQIDVRIPFALGDALFIEKVYYLESAENFQIMMRCKNEKLARLKLSSLDESFKVWLKLSTRKDTPETETSAEIFTETTENTTESGDWITDCVIEPTTIKTFGKSSDRYKYYVYSFDGVKIDNVKSKVEFYIFDDDNSGEIIYDEENALVRFTMFDINMSKKKVQMKKFTLD